MTFLMISYRFFVLKVLLVEEVVLKLFSNRKSPLTYTKQSIANQIVNKDDLAPKHLKPYAKKL